jgi:hypothetical protein
MKIVQMSSTGGKKKKTSDIIKVKFQTKCDGQNTLRTGCSIWAYCSHSIIELTGRLSAFKLLDAHYILHVITYTFPKNNI